MRFSKLFAVAFFLSCLAFAAPSHSQGMIAREISGFVRVLGGFVVPPGTIVTLTTEGGGMLEQLSPEGNGRFTFSSLQKGYYYVSARAPGYREVSQRADLWTVQRVTLYLNLVPEREPERMPSLSAPMVDERALRIPERARREFDKGKEALGKAKLDGALKHFRQAVEAYPEFVEAEHMAGTILMDQQKWAEAETAFRHCMEMDEKFAPSYAALGAVYNRTGRSAEAIPVLERGLELGPNSWQGHFELGQSLLAQNKPGEAETHARRAHELAENFPLVHVLLANAVLRQNNLPAARQEFQHFMTLAPGHPLAPQVKGALDQIETHLKAQRQPTPAPQP